VGVIYSAQGTTLSGWGNYILFTLPYHNPNAFACKVASTLARRYSTWNIYVYPLRIKP